ncbi:dihydrolipoyl dehydrogenase [Paracoccus sp. DMF-8]|uniref:dihydrolipoyl dehydrogenase n=1 Tax=Paracoccus sp. DMF-8 TaxID=3019445 RepID=UPI0023E42945|nr:dihydrolipoyl dehydrogenase [Paracoccus sp. DMF-8]MDF3608070.1 dihydrolipoyl dehydrogenase [Paracoccus sp. DMF-8]
MQQDFDVIVVGGGPGGYVAAIRAAQLGLKTALVEREHLGGICSNWGCIPTKALLKSAEILTHARHAADYGVSIEGAVTGDLSAMIKRARGVAERMAGGVGMLMRKNRVTVIWGQARLDGAGAVTVQDAAPHPRNAGVTAPKAAQGAGRYSAKHIILATGARPRALPGLEPDGDRVWSYFDALAPKAQPDHLLIIGSGAIGIEFAGFYAALGVKVTVVEAADRILPAEDAEISAFARQQFERQGIAFRTGATVGRLDRTPDGVTAHLQAADQDSAIAVSHVLVAAGVQPNSEYLGLEQAGVALDRGFVRIDATCSTNIPGIHAIGDLAGGPMLAHKAEHEAVICVEAIAGLHPHALNRDRIPGCTYCDPQIASVGMTEARAREAGMDIAVGKFPFLANGKAIALGADQGFVKVVFDRQTGELLGAHMIGAEVTEMIQGFVLAMDLESTDQELAEAVFPHPTISETMKEAVLAAMGRAINI